MVHSATWCRALLLSVVFATPLQGQLFDGPFLQVPGLDKGDVFGLDVRGLGDIDRDGIPEVAVGAQSGSHGRGSVCIFSHPWSFLFFCNISRTATGMCERVLLDFLVTVSSDPAIDVHSDGFSLE